MLSFFTHFRCQWRSLDSEILITSSLPEVLSRSPSKYSPLTEVPSYLNLPLVAVLLSLCCSLIPDPTYITQPLFFYFPPQKIQAVLYRWSSLLKKGGQKKGLWYRNAIKLKLGMKHSCCQSYLFFGLCISYFLGRLGLQPGCGFLPLWPLPSPCYSPLFLSSVSPNFYKINPFIF